MQLRAAFLASFFAASGFASSLSAQASVPDNPAPSVVYRNSLYNFCLVLPADWRGYTVTWEKWEGGPMGNQPDKKPIQGPKLRIRHPKWTETDPYEDIPILILTPAQWKLAESDEYSFSAAPIGPSELARNAQYVFALPARYNYDFAEGWQEVSKLLSGGALQAPCKIPRHR